MSLNMLISNKTNMSQMTQYFQEDCILIFEGFKIFHTSEKLVLKKLIID